MKKAERDAIWLEEQKVRNAGKRKAFETKLQGDAPEFTIEIVETDVDYRVQLASMLTNEGFILNINKTLTAGSEVEFMNALDSYEGIVPVESVDSEFKDAVKYVRSYKGNFEFMNSLQMQLAVKGFLSDGQMNAVIKMLKNSKPVADPIVLTDAVMTVRKGFAQFVLAPQTGLKTNVYNYEVFAILRETEKAYMLDLQATGKPTGRCCMCGLTLTNDDSIKRGIGPICMEKVGFGDWQSLDAELQLKSVRFQAWVPKSVIKEKINFD